MFGMVLKEKEAEEIIYLLKKEMDDVYEDLGDRTVEGCVKRAIEEKYALLFDIYRRMVPFAESMNYDLAIKEKRNIKKS